MNFTSLEELLKDCAVQLTVPGLKGWGTGFFVAPMRILTCEHVVRGGDLKNINVRWRDRPNFARAEVISQWPDHDVALLSFEPYEILDQPHPCVWFGENPRPRDKLFLYGYPDQDFPDGCPVTSDNQGLTGSIPPEIKFSKGQIRPGMSGAPLLNQRTGKLCGMVQFTLGGNTDLGGGAIPVSVLRKQLSKDVSRAQKNFHKKDRRWLHLLESSQQIAPRLVAIASAGSVILILLIRTLGLLQSPEILAYDLMLSYRRPGKLDKYVTIVGLTGVSSDDDFISDKNLLELLEELQTHNPKNIGLDIYRYPLSVSKLQDLISSNTNPPNSFDLCSVEKPDYDVVDIQDYCKLVNHLKIQSNIVSTCQVTEEPDNRNAYPPYTDINPINLGFADSIRDQDDVIRRHLLAVSSSAIDELDNSPCKAPVSFSFNLALGYLNLSGIPKIEKGTWQVGDVDFEKFILGEHAGGYQNHLLNANFTGDGYQILLNYRHPLSEGKQSFELIKYDIRESAQQLKNLDSEKIKDRIVIIGYLVVDPDKKPDVTLSPKGYKELGFQKTGEDDYGKIPGVFTQAHKVSQIVNAVLENRPLLRVFSWQLEFIWITVWGAFAGITVWKFRRFKLFLASLSTTLVLILSHYILLTKWGVWLPCVSAVLTTLLIVVAFLIYQGKSKIKRYGYTLGQRE